MNIPIRVSLLAAFAAFLPFAADAQTIITTDPAVAAAFQVGATIENFDNLPAFTITSYANGQLVPPANRFSSRNTSSFTSPFYNSGGASFNNPVGNPGTPIGIFDPSGAIAGD